MCLSCCSKYVLWGNQNHNVFNIRNQIYKDVMRGVRGAGGTGDEVGLCENGGRFERGVLTTLGDFLFLVMFSFGIISDPESLFFLSLYFAGRIDFFFQSPLVLLVKFSFLFFLLLTILDRHF